MGEKIPYKARKPGGGRKKRKPEYDAGKRLKEQLDVAIASFAKYRLVPIPAVAVMPVVYSTSRIMVMARSWADIL